MKHSILITLLACICLSACQQNTSTPTQVSEKYWKALKSGDITTAKSLVSKNTQANLDSYLALPDDKRLTLDNIKFGEEKTTVHTTITSQTSDTNQNQDSDQFDFETILVLEDGEWKIDASRTQIPTPQKADDKQFSDALQENLESMDEVLEEGADMLNEFMQEGSKEMSESLLKGMNKMNESLREAIENMKQRREQQDSPQPPADENGEGLI